MPCLLRESFGVCISHKEFLKVCPVKAFVITLGYFMLVFPFVHYLVILTLLSYDWEGMKWTED